MKRLYFILIFASFINSMSCMARGNSKGMTEVVDTFQIARFVVEVSLPRQSSIGVGGILGDTGFRAGAIYFDTIPTMNIIIIEDVSMAECSDVGYRPNKEDKLIETRKLPNTFVIRLFQTPEGYIIEALSKKYRMSFTYWKARTAAIAKSVIPIFKSIRILPLTEYDNSKSARKKTKVTLKYASSSSKAN